MLKYQPKRFWGMLSKTKNADVGITAESFATLMKNCILMNAHRGINFIPQKTLQLQKSRVWKLKMFSGLTLKQTKALG
jgi:hypothetical protein